MIIIKKILNGEREKLPLRALPERPLRMQHESGKAAQGLRPAPAWNAAAQHAPFT